MKMYLTICGVCLLMVVCGVHVFGQVMPTYIGVTAPIVDEFGRPLKGDCDPTNYNDDRVEIHLTYNGQIDPPLVDGTHSINNPIINNGVSHIGNLTAQGLKDSGLFAVVIATDDEPDPGTEMFVRVFNAPTLGESSFYGDSAVFTFTGAGDYVVEVTQMNPLDTGDLDLDGLNNSWERSYGSNPSIVDTDGDGWDDWLEHEAGVDPNDAESMFVFASVQFESNGDVTLSWESRYTVQYQIQYSDDALSADPSFEAVGDIVTADSDFTQVTIPGTAASGYGFYRIKVVQ